MKSDPLLAHTIGHTIIRAVVGDHELLVEFNRGISDPNDYVSDRSSYSWVSAGLGVFHSDDDSPHFLNFLCIWVAGYVGESVFAEADSTLCFTGPGWHRVGRSELVTANLMCEQYALTFGIPVHEVLEACMEVVDATLRKYQSVADRLFGILNQENGVAGYRLAALLAAIKEEDLSLLVCQRIGVPASNDGLGMGEPS